MSSSTVYQKLEFQPLGPVALDDGAVCSFLILIEKRDNVPWPHDILYFF